MSQGDMDEDRMSELRVNEAGAEGTASPVPRSAVEVSRLLGQKYEPTTQQQHVIEAGDGPALVVAGAGSGKTETMAARVVWLVANGIAKPGQILGLTFTRKAAGELAERIRERLAQLGAAGTGPVVDDDPLEAPTVSTYNSFANTIYRENALLIGREPEAAVLSEASAWQLADRIVRQSDDERLAGLGKSAAQITEAVLRLAHALSDNVVADHGAVRALAEQMQGILELEGYRGKHRAPAVKAIEAVSALPVLLELAARFAEEKRRRGFIEFSDQVAFALAALERVPAIADDYRARFTVVLLDEYQDTSVVQTRLLSALFRDHTVMAVGDPNQSIYGWRGASAANLGRFASDFSSAAATVPTFQLTTSWRNPTTVLDAANTVVQGFDSPPKVAVEALQARAGAPTGTLEVVWEPDVLAEARQTAAWFRGRLDERAAGEPPTAAMLCRSVKNIGAFTAAFDEAGVEYHVLGIGGLLEQPVVVDLVCALTVLVDADAGSQLIRLLAGARWRIGVADIKALRNLASELAKRDYRLQKLDEAVAARLRGSVAEDEGASIVDALDFIAASRRDDGFLFAGFSAEGLARLRELGQRLARLRTRLGLDLLDLVAHVVQEFGLDIEVHANERSAAGRASLDAFYDLAAGFSTVGDEGGGLRTFLGWLEQAEKRENLAPRSDPPEAGTVQILTIHGSKGLEWDLVAIPRLVEGELPGSYKDGDGWVRFGQLPYDFRGDGGELPVLAWRTATTQKEFLDALGVFHEELAARYLDEQRRLAYVAITRARASLLLSGSAWSTQQKPRMPSRYLDELQRGGLLPGVVFAMPEEGEENPLSESFVERVPWPHEPLGERRTRVEAAAAAVREAIAQQPAGEDWEANPWAEGIDRLLLEREQRERGQAGGEVPLRITASTFKDYLTDHARKLAELRRPVPDRPYTQTRIGTLFHAWVEERYQLSGRAEQLDASVFELDDADELSLDAAGAPSAADLELLRSLQASFEKRQWAGMTPVSVEEEIHLPLAGRVFVCKLDAVFRLPGDRYQIVDWKTGKVPRDAEDLTAKQYQLALYRAAYSAKYGIPEERIDAVFYYVAADEVIEPRLFTTQELVSAWLSSLSA